MSDLVTLIALAAVCLPAGCILYRIRYPAGLFPEEADPELERLRRTGRRRVLPLPDSGDRG